MSGSRTFQRITRETIDEHRQINFYLDQVSRTLETLGEGMTDVEPMRRLAAQIEGLKERLIEHQQSEEEGVFQAVVEIMPDCRVEISRLSNQHQKMIEILEMARIHAQCGEPAEADPLRVDLQHFLEIFRRHEQDEEQLLKLAMAREIRSSVDSSVD